MKKVILTIAVAFVFVFVGSVFASPPVPPPEEGFKIKTNTNITCTGSVSEDQSFTWNWTTDNLNDLDVTPIPDPALPDELVVGESVAQIRYEQEFKSLGGLGTTFVKDFSANSHPDSTPNLEVDKTIGYDSNMASGSIATHDERVAIEVVSAGAGAEGAAQFVGMLQLCPWSTVGDGFPATNEGIVMKSGFYVPATIDVQTSPTQITTYGGKISSHTSANAEVTANVAVDYEIHATGFGTVNAGMAASLWEGSTAVIVNDAGVQEVTGLQSRTTYVEYAEAIGDFVFTKTMDYQSVFTSPSPMPETIDTIFP